MSLRPKHVDQDHGASRLGWHFADLDEVTLQTARGGAEQSWATHEALQSGRLRAVELVEAKAKRVALAINAALLVGLSSAVLVLKGTPGFIPAALVGLILLLAAFFSFGLASGGPVSPLVSGLRRDEILEPEMMFDDLDIVSPVGVPIHRTNMMIGLSAVALALMFGTVLVGPL